MTADTRTLAHRIAARYALEAPVQAVALAGSRGAERGDAESDLDLYVYCGVVDELSVAQRRAVAADLDAERLELDNRFFEPGDEWIDPSGLHIDVMFRTTRWIEDQLDRVLDRHEASVGYSTCFWANVLRSVPLFDRTGWLAALQARARRPYPRALQAAVVAKNWPLLRDNVSSFRVGLQRAVARGDGVSANHRTAAWLASFFDLLFASNAVPHPGEKRLVALALELCPARPAHLEVDVAALIERSGRLDAGLFEPLDRLADELAGLLDANGLER